MSGEARPHGLPGPLPEGERVLWQGSPNWRALAWRAFHIRDVTFYFAAFAAWRAAAGLAETGSALTAAERATIVLPFAAVSVGMLAGLAWLTARYAVYTLTDRRVVLSTGVALSATVNLPLAAIQSVDLKTYGNNVGDLSLGLDPKQRIAFMNLWPHARPWRLRQPEPTLRAVSDPDRLALLVAEALAPGSASRAAQPQARNATAAGARPAMAT